METNVLSEMFGRKLFRTAVLPWSAATFAACTKCRRSYSQCNPASPSTGIPVDSELHSYWDKHDGKSFEERSIAGGRMAALRRVTEIALKLAALKPDLLLVDLGCGTGLFAKLLGPLNIVGVDISEAHLCLAGKHMKVSKASYLDWVPEAGSAAPDVAVHNNSIEDYEEAVKGRFFKHVYTWLAPGGYFLFQAYSPRDEPMGRCIRECSPSFAARHTVHLCDTGDYVTLAERAGFEVVSTELVHSEGARVATAGISARSGHKAGPSGLYGATELSWTAWRPRLGCNPGKKSDGQLDRPRNVVSANRARSRHPSMLKSRNMLCYWLSTWSGADQVFAKLDRLGAGGEPGVWVAWRSMGAVSRMCTVQHLAFAKNIPLIGSVYIPCNRSLPMPTPFRVGDAVYTWNLSTKMVDQKGRVSQILSSPLAYGNTVLPPGSVAVTFSDETSTLWISEEHVGVMLQRAEAERDESEEDRPSADGWPQDASKLGVGGYTSLSSMLGAMSSFFGLDKNGLATKQEDQEDSKEESDGKVAFAEGDVVDVWNYDASAWDFGAVVSQVLHEPLSLGGSSLPAGSILISLNGALRWLTPDLISLVVRRSDGVQPAASCDSDGSNPKQIVDTASTDASQPDDEDLVHKSLSTSTAASGRQPDVAPDAPPSPVNASGPKPSQSSGDVADLDEDQAPVTPATSTGSQGSGKAGPLPTAQATVIATLKVPDAMGPSAEFDGTPVSSRHSSPPVSPRTKDHKPTLEAPPDYERSKQRVLVVGPGFGRELNPQQGQLLESAGFQVRWVFDLPNPESPSFPILHYLPVLKQAIDEFAPHLLVCASKGGAYVTAVWQAGLWTGPTLIINRHPTLTSLPKGSRVVLAHGSNDEYYQYRREDLEALMRSGSSNSCFLYYTANSGVLGRGHTRLGDKHNMESLKLWDTLPRLCDAAMAPECPELTIMRSWRSMLAQERLDAEEWLGYVPGLRTLWQSEDQKGMDDQILFEVHSESEEYEKVASIFRAQPAVSRAYAVHVAINKSSCRCAMELAEGELARLLEETLANCLGYTAPREVLRTRRASQAVLARVEECLPGLPTQALDRDGTTLLHLSAGLGITELTQRVLERRSDVSSLHRQFGTPLHLAAERGHDNVARLLLAEKADAQQAVAKTEITALHVAAARGHVPVLHTLIEARADVNKANAAGATPLHCAVATGHVEAITALLQSNADTNSICHDGKSPLHFAAYQSLVEPLQVLLAAHASVNNTDAAGYTPLIFASREGHREVVEFLLDSMADANILSSDSEGPLHAAADRGHSGIVVLLLSRQADVEARNGDGLTALDMVAIDDNPAIAELLIGSGATSRFL
ncbi:Ankyrin-3 [Symbiodinium microadriaticum]|uniref:Ankyrin-3 n=1 Tax=Symbiodinium microadriaticum TaxID=2951 RepID=A0A1Q9CCA7_SYMMI|nr:Ankyrin-3 [Symbiodinium microadriaticum]